MNDRGFTLIEILVVAGIIALVTGFMIVNFSQSRVSLSREALNIADAIREAQSLALAGSQYAAKPRCGYGIVVDPGTNTYTVYAGQVSGNSGSCTVFSYTRSKTPAIRSVNENVSGLILRAPDSTTTADIFFAPPNPTVYIEGLRAGDPGANSSETITLMRNAGATCPGADCKVITVTRSGFVDIK